MRGGARRFEVEDLRRQPSGPYACELRELEFARATARRLRSVLTYGMPAEAQIYNEENVPTSRNLPMLMEFVFEMLTGPGASLPVSE